MFKWISKLKIYENSTTLVRAIFWVVLFILLINIIFIPGFLLFSHVSFRSIENRDVQKKIAHGLGVIQREIDDISVIAQDNAFWNDTYKFVETLDKSYVTENFDDNILKNINMNLFAIINTDGKIVYERILEFQGDEINTVSFDFDSLLKKYPELIIQNEHNIEGVRGILAVDGKILLVNSRPILTSQYEGPSRGSLIFGRFLDSLEEKELSDIADFPIITQTLDFPTPTNEIQLAKYVLIGEGSIPLENPRPFECNVCHQISRGSQVDASTYKSFITPINKDFLGGYSILRDLHQTPVAIMGIHTTREIELLEQQGSLLFILSFIGLEFLIGIFIVHILVKNFKNEEALDRETKLFRAVIDNVPEQIFAHDVNGRFILNNQRDAQIMGVANPEDLLGKTNYDFYPPELASLFQSEEKQVIEARKSIVDFEENVTRDDGKQHWLLVTKSPLFDKKGQITGIVGVARDITERKQREHEFEVIAMMSRSLRSAETSTELLSLIFTQIIEMLSIDFGTLELINKATQDAEIVYSFGANNLINGIKTPPNKGLNSFIRSTRTTYLDNNLVENPMALDLDIYSGCSAIAGAPMIAEEELIGFIWIGRKSNITEYEVHLLAAMADIAASSIRRMNLHELTEKRLNQLISLRKIDTSINNSKELEVILGVLLDQTCTQLQADAADVLICTQDPIFMKFVSGQGFRSKTLCGQLIQINEGPVGEASQNKNYVLIKNLSELGASHPLLKAVEQEGFVSYCAVPLLAGVEIKGVLEVFFRKEFTPDSDWVNYMETLAGQAAIAIEQVQLFDGLQHTNHELIQAYDETIEGWVRALDLRDEETEGHSLRVTRLCLDLAVAFGIQGDELTHIRRGALLHDIGKVGVPDNVLLKPGKLTDEEWVIMRKHPQFAFDMLFPIDYLRPALSIPYSHHEKWDGTGYPDQLKGEEIPFAARIFSVVDVWDALSSDRPYRKAWPKDEVMKYIKDQAGIQFDPKVVEVFLKVI